MFYGVQLYYFKWSEFNFATSLRVLEKCCFPKECSGVFLSTFLYEHYRTPCYVYSSAMQPTSEKATMGLARVGSRAALSFAFAFLRRAWRSGEDSDLCSDLLLESLEALRSLPEGTLFDESSMSSVWLEVVERSFKFLRSVVEG